MGGFFMYKGKSSDRYFFEADGYEFESEIVDIVYTFAKRSWGAGSIKFSTAHQDRYEGTDFFVLGIPTDITLAFETKNKTRKLGEMILDGVTVDFGIRFGNGKTSFESPVLVIGAKTALGVNKSNMWYVLDTIKTYVEEILDVGMDKYLLATDN